MYTFFVTVIPEDDKDFISEIIDFRESMDKDSRKYLIGPVACDTNKMFVFLPCIETKWRDYLLKKVIGHLTTKFAILEFGEGYTTFLTSDKNNKITELEKALEDQRTDLNDEIKDLVEMKDMLEIRLSFARSERDEAIQMCNKDSVLASAVAELKALRGKKKVLEAAQKVAEEFHDKSVIPESVKNLLDALK